MKISQNILNLGNEQKRVVFVKMNKDDVAPEKQTVTVNQLHHIHIIDRSGSMYSNIDELIENVKETINTIDDNDFISVIWFSGEGEVGTLVKAAKKDDSIKILLDTIKSTLGCTCFSEPLQEVKKIIEETACICNNFNITLFTDGNPVTSWSQAEEETKIFATLNEYKDKVIAVNTIGYGFYYNKELLTNIANTTEFGEYIHSSQIQEYSSIFSHNYERISDLCLQSTEITANDCDIIYVNSSSAKLYKNNLKTRMAEKGKNEYIIIGNTTADFDFTINNETFNTSTLSELKKGKNILNVNIIQNIKYIFAYINYYNGNRKIALDVINELKDKYIIDLLLNSFTIDEVAKCTKILKKCAFKPKNRFKKGECVEGYLPNPTTFCTLDLLRLLAENNAQYVYTKEYKRIGLKTKDTFNLFKWDDKIHTTKMSDLIFNDKELNVSLRSKITGTVSLNPNRATSVGLPETIKSFIYRNQTIIKDGQLNIKNIKVIVDNETLTKLNEHNGLVISEEYFNDNKQIVGLDLTAIPVVNQTYLSDNKLSADYILNAVMENNKLTIKNKIFKYFLSMIEEKEYSEQYSKEQVEVLKEHGIDNTGMYSGVKLVTAEKKEDDFYITRNLIFNIKGDVSLPSVNTVLKLKKEPTKGMKKYLYDEYNTIANTISEMSVEERKEFLKTEMKKNNKQLLDNKFDINISKVATVLTGNWYSNLTLNDKNEYEYNNGKNTLLVKTEKVKKYF